MLVSKKYSEGDIVSFKLVTTEEVVAKVVDVTAEGFLVNRPLTIIPTEQGVGLMQSVLSADINNDILLRNEHVLMDGKTIDQIKAHYIRTTTGLEVSPRSGLIT